METRVQKLQLLHKVVLLLTHTKLTTVYIRLSLYIICIKLLIMKIMSTERMVNILTVLEQPDWRPDHRSFHQPT